ncbi:serine/threonine protein kinase, partial [Streptomyces sp. NPDC051907]
RSRGRRRTALWAAALAVAVAGAGVTALTLRGQGGEPQGKDPKPSGSSSGPASPQPDPVPAGYRLVEEEGAGLSLPVPKGWKRKALPDGTIAFIDPTGLASLRVNVLDFATTDPLQHWKDDEATSLANGKLPGYERLRMQSTSFRGQPAAIWEFTFDGRAREFRAIDLGFGEPGEKEYALYLSAPSADWAQYKQVFDHARDGLRIEDD